MHRHVSLVTLFILLGCLLSTGVFAAADTRPNILLIVADDLGYSDIGPYGGEISTPTLDRLAQEGVRFSRFHVLPTCSPTRAVLLTGKAKHVAGLGVMGEFIYPEIAQLPGYAGHLSDQVATLPEILRMSGYHTYMAGKWHLGLSDEQSPFARGFEQTFTMLNGGGSHWADRRPLSPPQTMIYRRNGQKIKDLPDNFYSTQNYTDTLIEFIDSNREDGKPFFAYASYTAPHDPLHAPPEYIAKYKNRYDSGWDTLAQQRVARLKDLSLVPRHIEALPPNFLKQDWTALSEKQQHEYARDMEVYAAMVEYLDLSIGRLFDFLQKHDLYDNTLILFLSDNGANGAHATAYPGNGDGSYLASFNNDLDNRGLPNSFIEMGPGWASASSAPMRLFKSFTTQGGIKAPCIAKLPGKMAIGGQWSSEFVHVTDIMPTVLELAETNYPLIFDGKEVREPIGRSMVPLLRAEVNTHLPSKGIGYELFEMRAYLQEEWKLLRLPEPFGTGYWQIFNLRNDPGEVEDLSATNPDIKAKLIEAYERYARENDVFDHQGRFDALYRQAYGAKAREQ